MLASARTQCRRYRAWRSRNQAGHDAILCLLLLALVLSGYALAYQRWPDVVKFNFPMFCLALYVQPGYSWFAYNRKAIRAEELETHLDITTRQKGFHNHQVANACLTLVFLPFMVLLVLCEICHWLRLLALWSVRPQGGHRWAVPLYGVLLLLASVVSVCTAISDGYVDLSLWLVSLLVIGTHMLWPWLTDERRSRLMKSRRVRSA